MLSPSQHAAFQFFRERAADREAFSAADLDQVAGWQKSSFAAYRTKHIKEYLEQLEKGLFKIKPQFLRLNEEDFHNIVSQTRRTVAKFTRSVFDAVLKYEFLLPLTNERKLRSALDELFYEDHLLQRAHEIGQAALATIVPVQPSESETLYFSRVVLKVSSLLGGYSIGHVNGRFRAAGLQTYEGAARILAQRGRYLVDETTAVVRFILPIAASRKTHGSQFDVTKESSVDHGAFHADLDVARRLFIAFFVESVILDILAEDEIWFVESGPSGERLYVLEKERAAEAKADEGEKEVGSKQLDLLSQSNPLDGWLRDNGYADLADKIDEIEARWKSAD